MDACCAPPTIGACGSLNCAPSRRRVSGCETSDRARQPAAAPRSHNAIHTFCNRLLVTSSMVCRLSTTASAKSAPSCQRRGFCSHYRRDRQWRGLAAICFDRGRSHRGYFTDKVIDRIAIIIVSMPQFHDLLLQWQRSQTRSHCRCKRGQNCEIGYAQGRVRKRSAMTSLATAILL